MKKYLTLILAALLLCGGRIYSQVSAGDFHSLFICSSGEVRSAGRNDSGQLGDGTTTERRSAVPVNPTFGGAGAITAIAAGSSQSLFLKNDGTVWACGFNHYGQLGDGTNTDRDVPVQVNGLSRIIAIAAGNHSLFLKDDGTVWACGQNANGQLGDGTYIDRNIPVQVNGLTGIIAIAGGWTHSLFLKNDSTVWSCGANGSGQLGIGFSSNPNTPVQVSGLTGIAAVATGGQHSLFLKNDGTVWACGYNSFGQLGDSGTFNYITDTLVQVSGLTNITAVAAGGEHSLFLKSDSTVWACGKNWSGQLGDGTTTPRNIPVQVNRLTEITALAAGGYYSLFLKNDSTVWGTGSNDFGQFGSGNPFASTSSPGRNQILCAVSPRVLTISGRIISEAGASIPKVSVHLTGDKTDSMTTDISGFYSFIIEPGASYTITPSKNNDSIPSNSITSLDILLMRKHILGIEALPSPYKIIAAAEVNADGDTSITTQDILFTRSLILGNITSFPTNRLWQFVSSDYVFPDTQHPFPFDKTRTYINITTNQTNQNFIGIKLGDVNGSWDANTP